MTKLLYLFLFCLVPMEAQFNDRRPRSACPRPELAHGYARVKQRGRMVRFACYAGYELAGDKYSTCLGGRWDVPAPVCVRGGCTIPKIEHAVVLQTHKNAWLNVFCLPKYKGSAAIYCDGRNWNGSIPVCVPDTSEEQLSCDFETPDLCGWKQDSRHDFDWTRINKKTPSAFLFTGPAFDHTFGEGRDGYYMYIESSSKTENETARLISPVYNGDLEKISCFSFFYHMYGRSIGGLRIYQIPEGQKDQILIDETDTKEQYLLFEKWGNQGDMWYRNVSYLRDVSDNFQIVIEGIRGTSFTSDIAIDDVALLSGQQCEDAFAKAVTPPDTPDSCTGRCSEVSTPQRGCGCSAACIGDSDCCADFLDVCVFNPDSPNTDDDDPTTDKNSSDHPRTERLIASTSPSTTTTTTTTTTPKPTTTTPKPTTTTPKATTAKTTTTTKAATIPPKTLKPVVKPYTSSKVITTTPAARKMTTVKLSTKITRNAITSPPITARAQTIKQEEQKGSGAAAGIVVLILFVILVVGSALVARSARGRAAIARLRGRAASDPEVRYLTSDDD